MAGASSHTAPSISTIWNAATIAADLIALPRWLCWRLEWRNGKLTKVPLSGSTGYVTDATNSSTYVRYKDAAELATRRGFGIGIALGNGLAGIDLDKCRDPRTGAIAAWAVMLIRTFATYSEISPSGTGVKMFFFADLEQGRRRGPLEVYGGRRFFTVTGAHLEQTPMTVQPRQRELDSLIARLFPPETPTERRSSGVGTLADAELIERAMRARNGERFRRLWAGEWQALGYGSQSEADAALAAMLGFWCDHDPARVDALFRLSGLCRPKWTDRDDYRARTLAKVLH